MSFSINTRQDNKLNKSIKIIPVLLFGVGAVSWLSYTIIDQQKQIAQLEQQLQEVQMKYEIIKNDPLARDAMEAGG